MFMLGESSATRILSFANVKSGSVRALSAVKSVNAIASIAGRVLGDRKGVVVEIAGHVRSSVNEGAYSTEFRVARLTT